MPEVSPCAVPQDEQSATHALRGVDSRPRAAKLIDLHAVDNRDRVEAHRAGHRLVLRSTPNSTRTGLLRGGGRRSLHHAILSLTAQGDRWFLHEIRRVFGQDAVAQRQLLE